MAWPILGGSWGLLGAHRALQGPPGPPQDPPGSPSLHPGLPQDPPPTADSPESLLSTVPRNILKRASYTRPQSTAHTIHQATNKTSTEKEETEPDKAATVSSLLWRAGSVERHDQLVRN